MVDADGGGVHASAGRAGAGRDGEFAGACADCDAGDFYVVAGEGVGEVRGDGRGGLLELLPLRGFVLSPLGEEVEQVTVQGSGEEVAGYEDGEDSSERAVPSDWEVPG